jgi:GDP-mannose pyrophosphatase NudK
MKNEKVRLMDTEILSNNWYTLKKITYEYLLNDGSRQVQNREVYDRGNGATILLYNKQQRTVILTRQFRIPSFINGNESGMLIEACAGLLDKDDAEDCIRRETEEETGFRIGEVTKIMEAYMSPGSVTEIVYFFIGAYESGMKSGEGGGLGHEQEDIEVLELGFDQALEMMQSGEIRDGKTIMLLQWAQLHKLMDN